MSALGTIAAELVGLFVDDGRLAIAIVIWIAADAVLLPRLGLPGGVAALLLFAGLVAILLESALRQARRALEKS